jgi:hypothetical protein
MLGCLGKVPPDRSQGHVTDYIIQQNHEEQGLQLRHNKGDRIITGRRTNKYLKRLGRLENRGNRQSEDDFLQRETIYTKGSRTSTGYFETISQS